MHTVLNTLWKKWSIDQKVKNITHKIHTQTGHNFAHVTTAELLWHVQIDQLIWSLFFKVHKQEFFQDFDYEHFNHLSDSFQSLQAGYQGAQQVMPDWRPVVGQAECTYFQETMLNMGGMGEAC